MRVLHVISGIDPTLGGPSVALAGLAAAQVAEGLSVSVVTTWTEAATNRAAHPLREAGVEVHLIGPAKGKLSRHPDVKTVLRKLIPEAEVVHIHALWEEIQHQAAMISRSLDVPYIMRPCGMLDPWSLSQNALMKKAYIAWRLRRDLNGAAAIHFTAQAEADLTAPLRLVSPRIIEPNGVDLTEFQNAPPIGSFRARHGIDADRPLVLFLSRIHKKKGLDLLIPAFAMSGIPNAILVLAGPDNEGYGPTVQRLIDYHHLRDRVIITGMLHGSERIAALSDADLFVLPSYSENFGVVVVEALAAGTPVIISDQVNIQREIAQGGVGAVVVLETSVLSKELARWLTDDDMRAAAAARAKPFVADRYDWHRIAQRWTQHYQRLLVAAGSGVPRRSI
jgi:glycosyltransferase involved in cell wall biosynthesis